MDNSIIETAIKNGFIEYLGTTKNVIPFIINSDCVVLPSYSEGMSNILLEAASLSTPIITTNIPGCNEIVQDNYNGFLCKPKDADDLAEQMIKFINLPEKNREIMGINGRKKIKLDFDKIKIVNEYLTIVNNLS